MPSRLIPALLLAAALAFACGPRSRANETAARAPKASTLEPGAPPLTSDLDVRIGEQIRFALRVTNQAAKRLELTFPSGQTHDIVVLDTIGREVWRWSAGRMFTQALQNRVLDRSETASYDGAWSPEAQHGTFTAVVSLRSENHPLEQRIRFTLP